MTSAIIVAAGKGTRMGPGSDKLFLELHGRPVIAHTWKAFDQAKCIDEIIIVIREGMQTAFTELAQKCKFTKRFVLVTGGAERQDSGWDGLGGLSAASAIVAHPDRERPR